MLRSSSIGRSGISQPARGGEHGHNTATNTGGHASYGYASDLQYGQDSAGTYGPVYATENGIDTVNLLDAVSPRRLPHGATASGSWFDQLRRAAFQHVGGVVRLRPRRSGRQKADDGYSSVDVAIQAIDTDYITNTSNLPKTILFSYTLDTVSAPTGLLDQAGLRLAGGPVPESGRQIGWRPRGTIGLRPVARLPASPPINSPSAPGETVSWYQNYQFQGSAGWAYDPPPGPVHRLPALLRRLRYRNHPRRRTRQRRQNPSPATPT